jgi:hypothetical protein
MHDYVDVLKQSSICPFISFTRTTGESSELNNFQPQCAHRRALILPNPFELLPAGAVRFDVHTVRLTGGVAAYQVVREGVVIYHLQTV